MPLSTDIFCKGGSVRTRLLACLAGGFLGVVVGPVSGGFGLDPTVALVVFSAVGIAVGYVVSILIDVFASGRKSDSQG
jgi:hypothetical protein